MVSATLVALTGCAPADEELPGVRATVDWVTDFCSGNYAEANASSAPIFQVDDYHYLSPGQVLTEAEALERPAGATHIEVLEVAESNFGNETRTTLRGSCAGEALGEYVIDARRDGEDWIVSASVRNWHPDYAFTLGGDQQLQLVPEISTGAFAQFARLDTGGWWILPPGPHEVTVPPHFASSSEAVTVTVEAELATDVPMPTHTLTTSTDAVDASYAQFVERCGDVCTVSGPIRDGEFDYLPAEVQPASLNDDGTATVPANTTVMVVNHDRVGWVDVTPKRWNVPGYADTAAASVNESGLRFAPVTCNGDEQCEVNVDEIREGGTRVEVLDFIEDGGEVHVYDFAG